jgi:hypothetical protein
MNEKKRVSDHEIEEWEIEIGEKFLLLRIDDGVRENQPSSVYFHAQSKHKNYENGFFI